MSYIFYFNSSNIMFLFLLITTKYSKSVFIVLFNFRLPLHILALTPLHISILKRYEPHLPHLQ